MTLDDDVPDHRPGTCLATARTLAVCANDWLQFTTAQVNRHPSHYWRAAEFQGFVDGVFKSTNPKTWCVGIMESWTEIYFIVATYIHDHPNIAGKDTEPRELVLAALEGAMPCHPESPPNPH